MYELSKRVGRRGGAVPVECRHPNSRPTPRHQPTKKKRDISTSFRKGPVPRPLVNTSNTQQDADQEQVIVGIPAPASLPPLPSCLKPAASPGTDTAADSTRPISRASAEPVVAAAATLGVLTAQDLGLVVDDPAALDESEALLWPEADPLASFDRVLAGLLVAPVPPQAYTFPEAAPSSSSTSSNNSTSVSSTVPLDSAATAQGACSNGRAPAGTAAAQQDLSSPHAATDAAAARPRSSRSFAQSPAAAAAAPAVTVIHCEADYERELEAAAALQQLLVVKVESSQHLLQGVHDSSLRFQTHTNLPTQLNAYLPHSDLSTGFGYRSNGSSAASSSSSSSSTAEVLASMGVPLGSPAASNASSMSSLGPHSNSSSSGGLFGSSSSSSSSGEPFSPVHAWYKQLAAQYAHSAAAGGKLSPVRFLSLQCNSARARGVARRLGVSAPLATVLVDPATGRKLQEVCGAKIEQELPNGLLYFGGSDPQGQQPSQHLMQLDTAADLEALKASAPLSVVAFHVHAAPPCVRSYARMHTVAQQLRSSSSSSTSAAAAHASGVSSSTPVGMQVSFGVMDVDIAPEGGAVSGSLGLAQLPTYVIYSQGAEVSRLSSSTDRRRLGEVLGQLLQPAKQH